MIQKIDSVRKQPYTATSNACRLCAPLGASMAFKGIAGAIPLLHGSQGCSTYIRRYLISHFREPIDIASSSFSEETTIFGGGENLRIAISNLITQYRPRIIGIATTCLAETIGEDVNLHLKSMGPLPEPVPYIVHVSTPSYQGSHIDGFRRTVRALLDRFALHTEKRNWITLLPGMVSPADLRLLRDLCADYSIDCTIVPDYAETLDGGIWDDYQTIPSGGTVVEELIATGSSTASIEMGVPTADDSSAGVLLEQKCGVPSYRIPLPIGLEATDELLAIFGEITGKQLPARHAVARGRLIDAYVDGHKFVSGKRAAIFGDEDMTVALARFAMEIGMNVTAVMSGADKRTIADALRKFLPGDGCDCTILGDADFEDLREHLLVNKPDLLIGSSKGYHLARALSIPLVRAGFPVQDRIGAQRMLHLGYDGAQQLFDRIVNTLIAQRQAEGDIGYMTW